MIQKEREIAPEWFDINNREAACDGNTGRINKLIIVPIAITLI